MSGSPSNLPIHCLTCGSTRVVIETRTIDERYPIVRCEDCKKVGPGSRADVFDRRAWQERQTMAAIQQAAKKNNIKKGRKRFA